MLLGALFGLTSALIWAASSLFVKAQASRVDTFAINAFRILVGAIFFHLLLPFFGGFDALFSLQPSTYLFIALSVIAGIAVGDSIYFWSMSEIGATRAMPLSGIYPLFTWAMAVPLLGEPVTINALVGTLLVLLALWLLSQQHSLSETNDFVLEANPAPLPTSQVTARRKYLGSAAAVFAAFMWAVSTTFLRIGIRDEPNVIVVNAFRLPVAALPLLLYVQRFKGVTAWRGFDRKALPRLVLLGLFSSGVGSILWVLSVAFAGAARAALFSITSPLLGVPLAFVFLHERVTLRIAAGTLLAVAGVWLILS